MDGGSDEIAKPSPSQVVFLLDLGWAVSCPIMRRTVPQAQAGRHRGELVRNTNQGLYPRDPESGDQHSVLQQVCFEVRAKGHRLPSVSVTLSGKENKLEPVFYSLPRELLL